MHRNRILTAAFLVLVFLFSCSCGVMIRRAATPTPEPINYVRVDSEVMNNLRLLHYRLALPSLLPDGRAIPPHEWGACLEGRLIGDMAIVEDLGMANVLMESPDSVRFDCSNTKRRGSFLGIWHNHIYPGPCLHSPKDSAAARTLNVDVSIVSCNIPMELDFWTRGQ